MWRKLKTRYVTLFSTTSTSTRTMPLKSTSSEPYSTTQSNESLCNAAPNLKSQQKSFLVLLRLLLLSSVYV